MTENIKLDKALTLIGKDARRINALRIVVELHFSYTSKG